MREIKFRLWDCDNESFSKINFENLERVIEELDGFRDYFSSSYFVGENYLQQFTGLQDKNGVDAYSGDNIKGICVLTDENGYDSNIEIEGVINYSDEYSAFAFTNNIKTPLENYCNFMHQLSEFEIIGNIHENKI